MKHAAVVGAGAIGQALIKFLATTQPVERIMVASRTESSARQACEVALPSCRKSVTVCATADVQHAVRDADIIFTATGVHEDTDIVCAGWLKDDAIVCSLGSCREVDLDIISQAWIVVDDVEGLKLRRSDFREGGAGWGRIAGDVGSLVSGDLEPPKRPGKTHLVLVGLGVLDVALGARAISNARRMGLGVALETGRV